jgi:hypothetical protein
MLTSLQLIQFQFKLFVTYIVLKAMCIFDDIE